MKRKAVIHKIVKEKRCGRMDFLLLAAHISLCVMANNYNSIEILFTFRHHILEMFSQAQAILLWIEFGFERIEGSENIFYHPVNIFEVYIETAHQEKRRKNPSSAPM